MPYRRPMPANWWLRRAPYFLFMLRELTAVFIALYVVLLLLGLHKLSLGPAAFAGYVAMLAKPGWIALHVIALVAALYHTFTWFNLLPQATPIWRGEEKVPGALLVCATYAAWILVSAVLALLVLSHSRPDM